MLRWFDRALWIGPAAFFLTACAWSVLDVEFSTDTWMALAAGRQLINQLDWGRFHETFPLQDTFSYTFYKQPWFDGNWLSNLGQYWIFDRLGSSAVVYVTAAIAACIQAFVLLAVHWRTRSWLAAWLAAALVGIGARDFLEPRAAIVGLLCLAALWALICAIEGQHDRRRYWPIVLLLPLLVFWSNAHAGFVFGFGLIALYVGHWGAVRVCRTKGWAGVLFGKSELAADGRQILSISAVLIAAILIAAVLGPLGVDTFTHFGKIASGANFRTVSLEWYPAYSNVGGLAPPMWRFWEIVGLTGSGFLVLWLAGRIAARSSAHAAPERAVHWSLFDAAVVLIGLSMTLWARRFAPLLYVLSAPVLAIWVMRLAEPLVPFLRGYGALALKLAALLAAVATGGLTWTSAQRDLLDAFKDEPATGLLERTRGHPTLDEALLFVGENRLRVNMLTNYGDGGSVMFYAPLARVFIDGRGDQLYTGQHYNRYLAFMDGHTPVDVLRRSLYETGTDAVLVPSFGSASVLQRRLLSSPDWALVFLNARYTLLLRRDSSALSRLGELVRDGNAWWPSAETGAPYAQVSRAMVLLNTSPSNKEPALDLLIRIVDRQPWLGRVLYPGIARALAETHGKAAASDFVLRQTTRLASDNALQPNTRAGLLALLAESLVQLERAADP